MHLHLFAQCSCLPWPPIFPSPHRNAQRKITSCKYHPNLQLYTKTCAIHMHLHTTGHGVVMSAALRAQSLPQSPGPAGRELAEVCSLGLHSQTCPAPNRVSGFFVAFGADSLHRLPFILLLIDTLHGGCRVVTSIETSNYTTYQLPPNKHAAAPFCAVLLPATASYSSFFSSLTLNKG